MSHYPRTTQRGKRLTVAALAAAALASSVVGVQAANADAPSTTHVVLPGIILTGIGASGADAIEAYESPAAEGGAASLAWCTQIWSMRPTADMSTTSIDRLVSESKQWGPDEVDLTTPQMAWLLDRVNKDYAAGKSIDPTDVGAIGYLVHANYEMDDPDSGHPDAQANVDLLTRLVKEQKPTAWDRAVALAAEARNSAAVGYTNSTVPREEVRHGLIEGVGITNAANQYVADVPVKVVLSGPAVFDETGTKEWIGKSKAAPLTLTWTATGNGSVKNTVYYKGAAKALTRFLYGPGVQNTLSRPHQDPRWEEGPARTWNVVYDFQPMLTSNVADAKISPDGTVSDTLTVAADASYSNPEWIVDDAGNPVPVVFEGTAYDTGEHPADTVDAVPADAKVIGKTSITATGPGEYTAKLDGITKDPSFVTWVWTMKKADQTAKATFGEVEYSVSDLVHADWADKYGLTDETLLNPWTVEVDSTINTHVTKRGNYFSDDLFVTGMPEDHPSWGGSHGFKADTKTFDQTLLFFPEGLDVTEENKPQAEVIATVTVPAANGFYSHVGSTKFKVKDGNPAGTYVFVTSFAGDDRVQPFTSSVEDKAEQYVVDGEQPELRTTATDKADGDKTLEAAEDVTITDKVCYTNLKPGREYTLTGTLMDKTTGEPLKDASGEPITSTITHTPTKAEDCANVDFTVDGSALAGRTTVVFERLYQDGKTVAVHTNINDEGQTVTFEGSDSDEGEGLAATGADVAGVGVLALMAAAGGATLVLRRRSSGADLA